MVSVGVRHGQVDIDRTGITSDEAVVVSIALRVNTQRIVCGKTVDRESRSGNRTQIGCSNEAVVLFQRVRGDGIQPDTNVKDIATIKRPLRVTGEAGQISAGVPLCRVALDTDINNIKEVALPEGRVRIGEVVCF